MFSMDASKSSAIQTTQTASGQGQILSGKGAQVGTLNVGTKGTYTESGGLNLGSSKNAVMGSSFNLSGSKGSTLNVQNLDQGVVDAALKAVADIQKQSADQADANTAALKSVNDNLTAMLGTTPPDATTPDSTAAGSTLKTGLKWLGAGVVALVILYWLFKK